MTSWSRKQVDRGCRRVTTSTSTDVPRSSPRVAWGIIRVYDKEQADLEKATGRILASQGEMPEAHAGLSG